VKRRGAIQLNAIMVPLAMVAAFIVAGPAHAQDAALNCELHVWPGSAPLNLYMGWFHGAIIDGGAKGREHYPKAPTNLFSPEQQLQLLADADLPKLFKLINYRVVAHPEILDSRTIRTTPGRIVNSGSPCYAELLIDDLVLTQNVIGGNALRGSFRFRDFGADLQPRRTFGTWTLVKLAAFPPKAGQDPAIGLAEVIAAYRTSLTIFARALERSVSRGVRR